MVEATATTMGVVFAPGDTQRAQQTTKDRELHVRGGMHLVPATDGDRRMLCVGLATLVSLLGLDRDLDLL
jgi:hypothetical protein